METAGHQDVPSLEITGVTNNSRDIKPHDAFVAVRDWSAMNDIETVARILETVPHHQGPPGKVQTFLAAFFLKIYGTHP